MSKQRSLFDLVEEREKRDRALRLHEEKRDALVSLAYCIAVKLAKQHGTVTAPQVFAELAQDPRAVEMMAGKDPRWMGAVFRKGKGWRRVGWTEGGSHGRPVAIWERARC